jgi:hypothetical protein
MTFRPWMPAALVILFFAGTATWAFSQGPPPCQRTSLPVVVNLDDVKHVHLIDHERNAIAGRAVGELSPNAVAPAPRTLTLERDNADRRRTQDLRGIPTRPGFDRDEWPPAVTEESGQHTDGTRASVAYVPSAENRSGGSVLGAALRGFCDGQRFIVEAGRP